MSERRCIDCDHCGIEPGDMDPTCHHPATYAAGHAFGLHVLRGPVEGCGPERVWFAPRSLNVNGADSFTRKLQARTEALLSDELSEELIEMTKVTTAEPPLRVWRMNDCDWVAARTLTEAIDCYLQTCGASREEVLADEPRALTDSELARLTFFSEDRDEEGELMRHSFKTELARRVKAGVTFPQFFASTEF